MTEGSEMRGSMEALMLHYEVDVVFNGHVHAYERTNPVAVSLSFPWSAVAHKSTINPVAKRQFLSSPAYKAWPFTDRR